MIITDFDEKVYQIYISKKEIPSMMTLLEDEVYKDNILEIRQQLVSEYLYY